MSPPITTIMIGNPGVGKSTLLNCILGEIATFKSGVSFGEGLTKILQQHKTSDGNKYMDTPGLSDDKIRKQAGIEIEKALKTGGLFKIFFVITLEAGRVKPDDKTTIQLVLEAAPQIGNNYSIIVNKIPAKSVATLMANEQERKKLMTVINNGLAGTISIYYNIKSVELEDADNEIIELDPTLLLFINNAPTISIDSDQVSAIEVQNFQKVLQQLSDDLVALRQDNKLLLEKMEEQEKRFERQIATQEERYKKDKLEIERQYNIERQQRDQWFQEERDRLKKEKDDNMKELEELKDIFIQRDKQFQESQSNLLSILDKERQRRHTELNKQAEQHKSQIEIKERQLENAYKESTEQLRKEFQDKVGTLQQARCTIL